MRSNLITMSMMMINSCISSLSLSSLPSSHALLAFQQPGRTEAAFAIFRTNDAATTTRKHRSNVSMHTIQQKRDFKQFSTTDKQQSSYGWHRDHRCKSLSSSPVNHRYNIRNNYVNNITSTSKTATSQAGEISAAAAMTTSEARKKEMNKLIVLWRFARPHTIIGSALAIPALHGLAAPTFSKFWTARCMVGMIYATVPALFMNLYITGLNQITDVEIDKINKPNLPLASGELSMKSAKAIVSISLVVSSLFGILSTPYTTIGLNVALVCSAILGTVYSVQPFRFKRFPILAAFCIVAVRGAVINAGFFTHAKIAAFGFCDDDGVGGSSVLCDCLFADRRCYLSSLYFAIFGVVIALMKDVPDVIGDGRSNIRSFAIRVGPKRIFRCMHRLLTALFFGVGFIFFKTAACGTSAGSISIRTRLLRIVVGVSAIAAGISVQKEAKPVDPEDSEDVYKFYMHLWKLFYLSYFVLPLTR